MKSLNFVDTLGQIPSQGSPRDMASEAKMANDVVKPMKNPWKTNGFKVGVLSVEVRFFMGFPMFSLLMGLTWWLSGPYFFDVLWIDYRFNYQSYPAGTAAEWCSGRLLWRVYCMFWWPANDVFFVDIFTIFKSGMGFSIDSLVRGLSWSGILVH